MKLTAPPDGPARVRGGSVARTRFDRGADRRSLLEFVPYGLHSDILAKTSTADLTSYLANAAASGEAVYAPPGRYGVSGITVPTGARLIGAGYTNSEIFLLGGANASTVYVNGQDILFEGWKINGNRAGQGALGHGVRLANAVRTTVRGIYVVEAGSYGIGAQEGEIAYTTIEDCVIDGCGIDGVDIKNKSDTNKDVRLRRIRVLRFGLDGAGTSAGVDLRGPISAQDIYVNASSSPAAFGIRMREGVTIAEGNPNGQGAYKGILNNFAIETTRTDLTGLVLGARSCQASNGRITGGGTAGGIGISIGGDYAKALDVDVYNFQTGVRFDNSGLTNLTGKGARFRGSVEGAVYGVQVSGSPAVDRADVEVDARDCSTSGIRIIGGATNTRVRRGNFDNVAAAVQDGGTGTVYDGNSFGGPQVDANLVSAGIDGASAGAKVVTIPHGLSFTPTTKDVALTILQETTISDIRFGLLRVDGVNSTNIVARAVVTTASATAGATFGIGARVRARGA